MIKFLVIIMVFMISGCASLVGYDDSKHEAFYGRKAEVEAQCKYYAQNLYPGYPARRGILTNYLFTRAYDQCLEQKTLN